MKAPLFSSAHRSSAPVWRRLLPLLALFVAFGTSFTARAQNNSSITGSSVIIDRGNGNETFGGQGGVPAPAFDGANLGTFNVADFNTVLFLNGGSLSTIEEQPDEIRSAKLTYVLTNSNGDEIATSAINLIAPTNQSGAKTFLRNDANVNLLALGAGVLSEGTYTLSISFQAIGRNSATNKNFPKSDPPGVFYQADFTVVGIRPTEPPTSTTWTGGKNDNWFDPANWSNGVPNVGKDATIPDFGSGSVKYPNIYSDAIKPASTTMTTVTNADGTTSTVITPVPGYDNSKSGPAETRTFTMSGTSQAQRSISRLVVGRLNVYGNFNNQQGSFIQRENTKLAFAGTNQSISGSINGFSDVEIRGGGIKTLTTNFAIRSGATLSFFDGILQTDISNINVSFVELAPATNVNNTGIPSARIVGETETSYLRGFVKIREVAPPNTTQDFGNIGLSLSFIGRDPGLVLVTRNTAENYADATGPGTKPTIRRIFGVQPDDQATNSGELNATMTFHYLDNELVGLRNGNQSLDESKLALFVSSSAGSLFGQLGRDALDTNTNTLTKNNIRTFATFSLSEALAPLPVTLTAFNAKRVGGNAEITWETVTEIDSRGYEVQVSNDGRNYRTLAFVASAQPNSNQLLRYRYTDTEANKSGVRYYRLRQIDLDGTDHYYAPKVVTFDSSNPVGKAEVRAFPNPFGQELYLTANTSVAGKAQLTVTDMTGRVVGQHTLDLSAGVNDLSLPNAANLKSGIYLVRLVLPSGEAKVIRVNKE